MVGNKEKVSFHQEPITSQQFTITNAESFASLAKRHFQTIVQPPALDQAWTDLQETQSGLLYTRRNLRILGPTTTNIIEALCILSYIEKQERYVVVGKCDRNTKAIYSANLKTLSQRGTTEGVTAVEVGFAFLEKRDDESYVMEVVKFATVMGWFKNKNIKPNDPLIKHFGQKRLMKDMKVIKGLTGIKQPKKVKKRTRNCEATAEENNRKARKIQEEVEGGEECNLSYHQGENTVNNLFSSSIGDEPIQSKEVNHIPDNTPMLLPNSSDNDEYYDQMYDEMNDGDQNEDGIEDQMSGIEDNRDNEDDTTYSYENALEYLDVLPYCRQLVHFANEIGDNLFKEGNTKHFLDLDDAALTNMY